MNADEHSVSVTDQPVAAGPEATHDQEDGTPPADEFKLARVFDFSDPAGGPGFTADHLVISDPDERGRLLEYLRGGALALMSTQHMPDVLDADAPAMVPMNFFTDGEWVWTDTIEYYLSRHGIAPDPELAAHIDAMGAQGRLVPSADHDTAVRASEFLLRPRPAEPAEGDAVPAAGPDR